MRLVLVRHGEAEALARSDAERELTARGHEQARATAAWLRQLLDGSAPCLLASPYRRAQETAAALSEALAAPVVTVSAITPDDDPRCALAAIEAAATAAGSVVVVSHMPLVAALAGWLEAGAFSAGRGFALAEARVLEMELPGPGLARAVDAFLPGPAR